MKKIYRTLSITCFLSSLIFGLTLFSPSAFAEDSSGINDSSTTVESSILDSATSTDTSTSETATDPQNATVESTETEPSSSSEADNTLYFDDYYLPSSRSDLNPTVSARSNVLARSTMDSITAGEGNRPNANFIDISSHNGALSIADFQRIKSYGINGVVVKLTESTSYVNPYAQSQISNAQAAGLVVSAYHYAHYTSQAIAQAEANYFASLANSFNLPKSTVMVIDIEENTMLNGSLNANTTAFVNTLKANGFSFPMYYMNRTYATSGHFSSDIFGARNMWVAQYPYTPTASMNWNNEYSSWQWSSQYYVPGIAHPFDISMDYTGYLENGAQGKWLSENKYVTITKKDYPIWSNFNFNSSINSTTNVFNQTYRVSGRYEHLNGSTYYSLYDNNNNWKGYVNSGATTTASGAQGIWLSENKYVTLTQKGLTIWGDINNFSTKKGNTTDLYQKTYRAQGKYNHVAGVVYYSLYDNNGTWIGYVNASGVTAGSGPQGAWLNNDQYVTISKKDQTLWGNIDTFSSKKGNTTDVYQQTFHAKIVYNHIAGPRYYSLYDNNDKWIGYLNANSATVAAGPQGTWLSNNQYVTITKKDVTLWGDINSFSSKKGTTSDLYQKTVLAQGKYNHFAKVVYYSLYDNTGKWLGYLNSGAASVATGAQGIWIKNDEQVTISKKNYTIWGNIDTFSSKKGNTTELYNETLHAQGIYNHFADVMYYSLYDKDGRWIGYLNAAATTPAK